MKWIVVVTCLMGCGVVFAEEKEDPDVQTVLAEYKDYQRLSASGKFAEALLHAENVARLTKKVAGDQSQEYSTALNNVALMCKYLGQYDRAITLYLNVLKIRENKPGIDPMSIAIVLNNIAGLYMGNGQYEKAASFLERSRSILEASTDYASLATCLVNLGMLYREVGAFEKVEPLLKRALEIREDKSGADHPETAICLNQLAEFYRITSQYNKAEPLFKKALSICEKLGADHPYTASTLTYLGTFYENLGQFKNSETYFRRALAIYENRNSDNSDLAASLNNLAMLYVSMGKLEEAEPLYMRSLDIVEKKFADNLPMVATGLDNLAGLYLKLARYEQAEKYYLRSQSICEKLGPNHPYSARTSNNLALLYERIGQHEKALPLYKRASAYFESTLGPNHPDSLGIAYNLAGLYAALGDDSKAMESFQRVRRSTTMYVQRTLPALTEYEQQKFLSQQENEFFASLALGSLAPDRAALSAPWLFNGKGQAQRCQAERAQLARESKDPATERKFTELTNIRGQLARATLSAPKPGQEQARFDYIKDLETKEERAAKALAQAQGRIVRADPWISLADVQNAIPGDAALIDIVRFDMYDFKEKRHEDAWKPAHYAAWITSKTDVEFIDLGEAAPIDAVVQKVRDSASDENIDAAPALKALAALVLAPLEKYIVDHNRWLLSPDGDLWLAPWAALPLSDGSMVIEKHSLSYLVSGRDLVNTGYKVETTAPVIFANPDFGAVPRAEPAKDENVTLMITRSADLRGDLDFKPLPGTAKEAEAIRQPIADYARAAPQLFLGAGALEANAKALKRPKVLVMSTHGFFLPQQPRERDPRTGELKPNLRAENPLLRCGLALTGANEREKATGENDGIFTGLEIVATDLRGTDLVVLSACDTGIGQVNTGEGVAGLRQCFQLAGANSVVATLWKIPDTKSSDLMRDFFKHLSAGQPKADALRQAQADMIARLKKEGRAPHPFYWAAFTLTGEWK